MPLISSVELLQENMMRNIGCFAIALLMGFAPGLAKPLNEEGNQHRWLGEISGGGGLSTTHAGSYFIVGRGSVGYGNVLVSGKYSRGKEIVFHAGSLAEENSRVAVSLGYLIKYVEGARYPIICLLSTGGLREEGKATRDSIYYHGFLGPHRTSYHEPYASLRSR